MEELQVIIPEEKNGSSFEAIDTLVHECLNEKSTDVEIARQPRGKKLDSCKRARDRANKKHNKGKWLNNSNWYIYIYVFPDKRKTFFQL